MRATIAFLFCACAWAQTIPSPGPGMYPSVVTCTGGSCSDSFAGAAGTLLATHDANWSGTNVGNCKLSGSGTVQTSSAYVVCGASYSASTASTSQIVASGFTGGTSPTSKCAIIRSSGSTNYDGCLGTASGGNWTKCQIHKSGTVEVSTAVAYSQATDHTIKLVASGTGPVVLTVYIDGTSACTYTDSTSPIASGNPGFYVSGNGTTANNQMSAWQDH